MNTVKIYQLDTLSQAMFARLKAALMEAAQVWNLCPETSGACMLVWNNGFELHVCVDIPQAAVAPGTGQATVDLGEIHLAAVTTAAGQALIVTGRGIRSCGTTPTNTTSRLTSRRCTPRRRHL